MEDTRNKVLTTSDLDILNQNQTIFRPIRLVFNYEIVMAYFWKLENEKKYRTKIVQK